MAGDGWNDADVWKSNREDHADQETARAEAWKDDGWSTGASASHGDGRYQCASDGWSERHTFTWLPEWAPCVERVEARQNEIEARHRAEVATLHDRLRVLEDRVRSLELQSQVHEPRPTAGATDELGRHGNPIVTCVRVRCGRRFETNPRYRNEYCCSCCRNGENGHASGCESRCLPAQM